MTLKLLALLAAALLVSAPPLSAQTSGHAAPAAPAEPTDGCGIRDITRLGRNPTPGELRCRYGVHGPGRFGLLSYLDIPVYQPVNPLPGTHVVGVPGMPRPRPGESYEAWEWRVLRTVYGPGVRGVQRGLELLDPVFASRIMRFERLLRQRGVRATRRETYRPAERQAYIFQQGRSRPGPISTTTLTSWHNRVDRLGRPAARAADYDVASGQLARFHALADSVGLMGYGADSNDPGHVYWPDEDAAEGMEIAVLRLVRRVPHVTLETGRPADESPTAAQLAAYRQATQLLISRPFQPFPQTRPVLRTAPPLRPRAAFVPPPRPLPPPEPAQPARRRGRRGR